MSFESLLIETIDGYIQLNCKFLKEWRGICGNFKLLENIDNKIYLWCIIDINDGFINKVVEFENIEHFCNETGYDFNQIIENVYH